MRVLAIITATKPSTASVHRFFFGVCKKVLYLHCWYVTSNEVQHGLEVIRDLFTFP